MKKVLSLLSSSLLLLCCPLGAAGSNGQPQMSDREQMIQARRKPQAWQQHLNEGAAPQEATANVASNLQSFGTWMGTASEADQAAFKALLQAKGDTAQFASAHGFTPPSQALIDLLTSSALQERLNGVNLPNKLGSYLQTGDLNTVNNALKGSNKIPFTQTEFDLVRKNYFFQYIGELLMFLMEPPASIFSSPDYLNRIKNIQGYLNIPQQYQMSDEMIVFFHDYSIAQKKTKFR